MKKQRLSYILFLIGLTIFLYPKATSVSNYFYNKIQIDKYNRAISAITVEKVEENLQELQNNNDELSKNTEKYIDPFIGGVRLEPSKIKTVNQDGILGYLEIPKIKEMLPIYLGATNANLAKGVAQIEKTSLPVGGVGTHCVIAGHRGYSYMSVFRYLDELEAGDRFYIHVYEKILTYEVTGQEVIKPNQTEKLDIDPEKDQVTLLTCTPYRVSTHRLLIHSERVQSDINGAQTSITDAFQTSSYSTGEKGATESQISAKSNYVDEISLEARNHNYMIYAIVGFGSLLWIFVFVILIKTFRKKLKQ